MTCVTLEVERESKSGSNGWQPETRGMSNQLVKVSRSCELTMAVAIGCISRSTDEN